MKVLITGGAGFIGSNLVKQCVNLGWSVDVVDDLSNGHLQFLPQGLDDAYGICVNDFVCNYTLTKIKNQKYDTVFHIAALPRVSYSVEYPVRTNDVNVTKTLKLLEACFGNVNRVVFASSSSVYGGADVLPTPETYAKNPKSPYALQKSVIEDYLELFYHLKGLDSVSLRFFNVFGENQLGSSPYSTAVAAWLSAIKLGKSMRSDGTGEQTRDMCHVDNVVDACIRSAKMSTELKAQKINVACGDVVSNNDILKYLLKRYPGSEFHNAPWRPGDVMHTHADVSRAKEVLGYVPVMKFWDGLEKTIEWVENKPDLFLIEQSL